MVEHLPRTWEVLGSRRLKAVSGSSFTSSIELDGHRGEAVNCKPALTQQLFWQIKRSHHHQEKQEVPPSPPER